MTTDSTSQPVRIGVIGVGQIGKHHLENYQKVPGVEVVAIADIDAAEAQRVAARFGIAHVYTDFRELLRREDIVAVDVCLHNNLHMPARTFTVRSPWPAATPTPS